MHGERDPRGGTTLTLAQAEVEALASAVQVGVGELVSPAVIGAASLLRQRLVKPLNVLRARRAHLASENTRGDGLEPLLERWRCAASSADRRVRKVGWVHGILDALARVHLPLYEAPAALVPGG